MAPGMLPIPPITAAVKPFSPALKPISGEASARRANITPAAPASAEPMMNVITITRSTSMPIIDAASRSYEVARIALPICVLFTSSVSAIIRTNAESDDDDPQQRDVQRAPVEPLEEEHPAAERERVVVAVRRAEEELRAVLEEERDAERRDQRRDPRRVAERPVREPLDRDAEPRGADHRDEEHQHHHEPDRDHRVRRAAERGEDAEADVGADHVDVAVREVEQLQDPVDHRVAEGDEGVDAAEREAVDEELDELVQLIGEAGFCHETTCGPAHCRAARLSPLPVTQPTSL